MPTAPLRNPVQLLQSENSRLRAENRDLTRELNLLREAFNALRDLQEVSQAITVEIDVLSLMERILQVTLASVGANDGSLLLIDEETNELVFVVVHGRARPALTNLRIPLTTGIAGWVATHNDPVIVPNVNLDPRFSHSVDDAIAFQTHSILCVPLSTNEKILGVVQAINKTDQREFDDDDLNILCVVAQLAAYTLAKAETIFATEDA